MWVGIKKALNSTLGTANFKPLDVLLTRNKILQPSNDIYRLIFNNAAGESQSAGGYFCGATFECDGVVKVFVAVKKGAVVIERQDSEGNTLGTAGITAESSITNKLVNVKSGDRIGIVSDGVSTITQVFIGAVESDSNLISCTDNVTDDMGNWE